MEDTVNILSNETIYLLEKSKKEMNKYALERKQIFKFLSDSKEQEVDLKAWQDMIEEFKRKLNI